MCRQEFAEELTWTIVLLLSLENILLFGMFDIITFYLFSQILFHLAGGCAVLKTTKTHIFPAFLYLILCQFIRYLKSVRAPKNLHN